LAAQAQALAVKARERDPVDIFRDDMMRAAKKGLFSVHVDLGPHHGTKGFFRSPDVQTYLGDALADEGIKISFGEPPLVDGYPTVKLDWFKTRQVVKWSRVVRKEKAAAYYKENGVPVDEEADVVIADHEDENVAVQTEAEAARFRDSARKAGVNYDTSGAVVDAIRSRRQKSSTEKLTSEEMDARRQAQEAKLLKESVEAVKSRAGVQ